MMSKNSLAKAEKYKKYKYLQDCLEHRSSFTLMVYSVYRIPGVEALASLRRLAALLRFKLNQKFS